jgi:uncharacterized membrane protein
MSTAFEAPVNNWIHIVGTWIEILSVLIIVLGIVWSTYLFVQRRDEPRHYDRYKIRIGRSLLLDLELLVAADIIKTVAVELSFTALGLLAGLVGVRTFLSWTLLLDSEHLAVAAGKFGRERRGAIIGRLPTRVDGSAIFSVRGHPQFRNN